MKNLYVPIDPVCCDDYVVVKYFGRDNVVVDFPCGTENVQSSRSFHAKYRPISLDDKDALRRVSKHNG